MKPISAALLTAFSLTCAASSFSQTLFTYGSNKVTRDEFLHAFNKNNNKTKPGEKEYKDYLELYIRYKLKVQAAYDQHLDTLPSQIAELQNFRNQVADQFMVEETTLQQLTNEAFERSQKDIHIAHIFIPFTKDSADALKKITAAYDSLQKKKSFTETALAYSLDPSVRQNKGDIGWITVFSLPYVFENEIYHLSPGAYSKPIRSKQGYHIFKNIEERKAVGTVSVAHILLSFTPAPNDQEKASVKHKADSLSKKLQQGANFSKMAADNSMDNLSYHAGGQMQTFGVGVYEPAFEEAAFALRKDGEISQPVLTSQGYHIIKRLSRIPISSKKTEETLLVLRAKVQSDTRKEIMIDAMLQKLMAKEGIKGKTKPEMLYQYREKLEQYNPAFATQLNEFKDGNLLFEAMQRNVWDKASADSAGLKNYYEKHKARYSAKPGGKSTKAFDNVRGFVLNDYQTYLEQEWIDGLKKKYPVVVDEGVLGEMMKK